LADGEGSIAALRASLAAHQPLAAFARRFGQRGVNELHQLLIALG